VKKAVLIAAVPPIMLRTEANPEGLPMEVFDKMRASVAGDRSQYYKELAIAFYGANRPGAKVSQGILDQFWLWSMQAGAKNAYESIKAFSETDFTQDLKKFDVPTLVLHGEDDQIVPVKDSARKSAKLIKGAKETYYPGAPHGLTATHQDQVNADLLPSSKRNRTARPSLWFDGRLDHTRHGGAAFLGGRFAERGMGLNIGFSAAWCKSGQSGVERRLAAILVVDVAGNRGSCTMKKGLPMPN
jgi:dienelactone hydrolase